MRIDSAEHPENEAGGLAAAIVGLSDEILVGRSQDHREADGLDLAGALEPHLDVQTLDQLLGQIQILERHGRRVHRVPGSHLDMIPENPRMEGLQNRRRRRKERSEGKN